jgi:hypothetical protein
MLWKRMPSQKVIPVMARKEKEGTIITAANVVVR